MLKNWKCKISQIIRCLIKPLLKNSTQTIFQLGTPWVTEILNNVIVSMVRYCAQLFLGWKKNTKPVIHLSLGKAGPFTLESHIIVKPWKCKVSQIIRCLNKPLLKNSTQNNVIVSMVLYCAQKLWCVFLDLKGTSIESRFMSIEMLTYISWLAILKIVQGGVV